MSDSKLGFEAVLNENSVLRDQQTGDNVTGQLVTRTARRLYETQNDASEGVHTNMQMLTPQYAIKWVFSAKLDSYKG